MTERSRTRVSRSSPSSAGACTSSTSACTASAATTRSSISATSIQVRVGPFLFCFGCSVSKATPSWHRIASFSRTMWASARPCVPTASSVTRTPFRHVSLTLSTSFLSLTLNGNLTSHRMKIGNCKTGQFTDEPQVRSSSLFSDGEMTASIQEISRQSDKQRLADGLEANWPRPEPDIRHDFASTVIWHSAIDVLCTFQEAGRNELCKIVRSWTTLRKQTHHV